MSTEFRTEFEAVAMAELLGEFGETVTYKGRGAPREIAAIVDRSQLQAVVVGEGVTPIATMRVTPDPTNTDFGGIDPQDVIEGMRVRYRKDIDGLESDHMITRRLPNEGGFVMFEVE